MGSDEGKDAAAAALETALGAIEAVNSMADIAKSMKDALEHRGFATPVADTTGVQFMFAVMAMNAPTPGKKR